MEKEYRPSAKVFIELYLKKFQEASAKDAVEKLKAREEQNARLLQQIHELKQGIPHPCDGPLYDDWSIDDFFQKVTEEYAELCVAYRDWKRETTAKEFYKDRINMMRNRVMQEATDTIIATVGLMDRMGCDSQKRAKYMAAANKSNATRDGGKRFKQ